VRCIPSTLTETDIALKFLNGKLTALTELFLLALVPLVDRTEISHHPLIYFYRNFLLLHVCTPLYIARLVFGID
jgi:hypothetical protein